MAEVEPCQIPTGNPPQDVVPNFADPSSSAYLPKIFIYITSPVMIIFLALRLYTRFSITHNPGWDDYLCILAAATMIAQMGIMFDVFGNTSGTHMRDVPLCEITVKPVLLGALQWILYQISALSAKTAILVLYRRIFSPVRLANILIFSSITFTVVFYISMVVAFIVGVVPRSVDYAAQLSAADAERAVRLSPPLTATCSVIGLVIDVYILVVPFFIIWDLNIPVKRKIGTSAVFITGSTAVIFSLVGAVYRLQLAITKRGNDSWVSMPMFAMNVAEINIGIAASCMPVVFVLFKSSTEKIISFVTKLWLSVTRRSQGRMETPGGASSISPGPYQEVCNEDIPDIPAAEVTGLRSFLRNIGRTNPVSSHRGHSMVMLTEASEISDYHDHLRNGRRAATRNQILSSC